MEPVTDIDRFFRPVKESLVFTGRDQLVARISERLEGKGFLKLGDPVQALGIMDLEIDGTYTSSLHLLAVVTMRPSVVDTETVDEIRYVTLTFLPGDTFLESRTVVQNPAIIPTVWKETIDLGNFPPRMTYEDRIWTFDTSGPVAGVSFGIDHAIFEMIYAYNARSKKDLFTFYRHTAMDPDDFLQTQMDNAPGVAASMGSTTSRLSGAYLTQGLLSAVLRTEEEPSEFEDLLRGKPVASALIDDTETEGAAA